MNESRVRKRETALVGHGSGRPSSPSNHRPIDPVVRQPAWSTHRFHYNATMASSSNRIVVLVIVFVVQRVCGNQWTHSEALDAAGEVVLRWQPRHQEILFRLEVRTKGYVTLGFTHPNNVNSKPASDKLVDIVLGWVDDHSAKAILLDCHGTMEAHASPLKDEIDNYTLMSGAQNDTHTILEFRRVLDTCDPDDYILTADTVTVLWTYHDSDPKHGAKIASPGKKHGAQSLHLLGPPPVPKMAHVRHWDVTLDNFEVMNNMDTIYWCKIFKPPPFPSTHHIVGYEPLLGPNHTHLLHHMILHECALDPSADSTATWDAYAAQDGHFCYGPQMSPDWEQCLTPLIAWAVGSSGEELPRHVGLPLNPRSFYMLEAHFDNPSMRAARATSGLRLRYTQEVRAHSAGILTTGIALSSFHFVPPNQREYATGGYCSFECTRATLPKEGVRVVSVMLHSHRAGRRLRLRHVRAGRELRPLAQDDQYDFNYQQTRALLQETVILPGDGLITECVYSTVGRAKPTLGGYSTKEEMCLAFVLYYPRQEVAGCYSMPPIKYFFEAMGVKEFYGRSMNEIETMFLHGESAEAVPAVAPASKPLFSYKPGDEMSPEANRRAIIALQNAKDYTIEGEESIESQTAFEKLIIKAPEEFENMSFMTHLQNVPYKEKEFTKALEKYFYKGLHLTFCRKRDDTLAIKEQIVKLPNFTEYAERDNSVQCSYKLKRASQAAVDAAASSWRRNPFVFFVQFLFILIVNV